MIQEENIRLPFQVKLHLKCRGKKEMIVSGFNTQATGKLKKPTFGKWATATSYYG
jgi:hypothetical protein